MADDLTDPCEFCGADSKNTAFVKYHADPNDAQRETEWFEDTPETIYSIVCTECGMGQACLDPRENEDLPDFEELPDGTGGGSFRVDETLE